MYFSGKLVEDLVLDLANLQQLNNEAVQNLIYHLKLPGDAIPDFIAEIIAEKPSVGGGHSHFPGRLAYGILDDSWLRLDLGARYTHQAMLCKKVERIKLGLQRLEQPLDVIDEFGECLELMVFATAAVHDLGAEERTLSKPELAIFAERIIEAQLIQEQLMERLLQRVIGLLLRRQKNRLQERIFAAVQEGLENEPWDDTNETTGLYDINEPIRFRLTLVQREEFSEVAWDAITRVAQLCRH